MKRPAAFLALLLLAAGAAFADDLGFILENRSGAPIDALYLSARTDKDWNANLLGDGVVVADGAKARVQFSKAPTEAIWDVRVVDTKGNATTFDDVNLANVETLRLDEKDGAVALVVE